MFLESFLREQSMWRKYYPKNLLNLGNHSKSVSIKPQSNASIQQVSVMEAPPQRDPPLLREKGLPFPQLQVKECSNSMGGAGQQLSSSPSFPDMQRLNSWQV